MAKKGVIGEAIADLKYTLNKPIEFRIISEDGVIAYYRKGVIFINENAVDIDNYMQIVSIAAHEIGHNLYSPVYTEVAVVGFVIAQTAIIDVYKQISSGRYINNLVLIEPQENTFVTLYVKDFTNLIDDQIVNASVAKFMAKKLPQPRLGFHSISEVFKEWLRGGAELKNGKTYNYSQMQQYPPSFRYHLSIMQKIYNNERLPSTLQKLVDKGAGISNIQEYYKNYYEYAVEYLNWLIRNGAKIGEW